MLTHGESTRWFQQARALHARGDLAAAAEMCRSLLETHPRHFDALNLSAIIAFQSQDLARAITLFDRAIRVDPSQAMLYCNRGLAQQQLRQRDAALASYDKAIALKPDFVLAHYNRGNLLQELRQFDAASTSFARATAIDGNFFHAWYGRGNVLKEAGQWDAALACLDRAVQIKPDDYHAHFSRGVVLQSRGAWSEALSGFVRALQIRPDKAEAHHNCGVALLRLARFSEALVCFDAAIKIQPELADAFSNRAVVLKELQRFDAALASIDQALALRPGYAEAYVNRSDILMDMGRFEDALAAVEQAVQLRPDLSEPHRNRGVILAALNRVAEAMTSYDRAIGIAPEAIEAHVNRAMAALLAGNFEAGWAEYEWRLRGDVGRSRTSRRDFPQPRWCGQESLAGKSIMLHSEQGLGDALQFCRYVPLVAALGARVILEAPKPLEALFASVEGASQVVSDGATPPETDYVCSLMSLPLAFNTELATVPARVPYLKAPVDKVRQWHDLLGSRGRLRVGLVWSGGFRADQPEVWAVNRRRNIPLTYLARLDHSAIDFISLQKGQPAESELTDLTALGRGPAIADFSGRLQNFADTAALIENLDLVISVDTSTAHLAGALGKPVWMLNRFDTCWRWLLDRNDSPWYPTMRIYRQRNPGEWDDVLERVLTDLDDFVARIRANPSVVAAKGHSNPS